MSIKEILPADVYRLHQELGEISIVDVREADEFAEVSSPIAVNRPLSAFDVNAFAKEHGKRDQFYLLCRSGRRSMKVAQMLNASGFESIYNVEGGMLAWEEAGLPVVKKL